ncbi:MAG: SDR family NAD(P)-dependent oxidoreductase [Candidatus Binatia bacterium]|jgi:short-subunit dehydrogenase
MHAVVITGIAQGMGREVARLLAGSEVPLAGFDVDGEGIGALRAELENAGCSNLLTALDITDRRGILRFRDAVLEKFKRVDVVLSNVGIGFFGPFEEADLEKALKCFEINVIGTAAIFQAFLPSMRAQRSGRLIAVSSLVGQIPFPFESIYAASKFAVEGLVLSLRYEVEPFGVKVALIQPAQVSTAFAAKIHKRPPKSSPYFERVDRFIKRDEELITSAPTPAQAAAEIVKVIRTATPKLHNQVDTKSKLFLTLNRFLPQALRDAILLRQMDIGL